MGKLLCDECGGRCCRYLALPLDTPETRGDFDDIRWFLAHRGISVFVEKGDWYINIDNRCRYLTRGNRCGIYENRPRICRGYKHAECDLHGGEYDYEVHLKSVADLEKYLGERAAAKRAKRLKKKAGGKRVKPERRKTA